MQYNYLAWACSIVRLYNQKNVGWIASCYRCACYMVLPYSQRTTQRMCWYSYVGCIRGFTSYNVVYWYYYSWVLLMNGVHPPYSVTWSNRIWTFVNLTLGMKIEARRITRNSTNSIESKEKSQSQRWIQRWIVYQELINIRSTMHQWLPVSLWELHFQDILRLITEVVIAGKLWARAPAAATVTTESDGFDSSCGRFEDVLAEYLGPLYAAVLREAHDDLALIFTPDPSYDSDCTRLSSFFRFSFLFCRWEAHLKSRSFLFLHSNVMRIRITNLYFHFEWEILHH